jgi:glutathione synthase/RimK-type ligase-like ATP-grasp enzyme
MYSFDIVILTQDKYVNHPDPDWYAQQVITEDNALKEAFEKYNLAVTINSWSDPQFDWNTAKFLIFRSTWDYFDRLDEFKQWLDNVKNKVNLINTAELIEWNLDKTYLFDLQNKGIPIVPTKLIKKGQNISLKEVMSASNWKKIVLKPTVSGAAKNTYLIDLSEVSKYNTIYEELVAQQDMLIQPFMEHVITRGEVSHIILGGIYSHSILKIAEKGDFRVQDDFGGSIHLYAASPEEVNIALDAVKACPTLPAYARVDLLWDNTGKIVLGEIELIEPELWFRKNKLAADKLATYIVQTYF